MFWSGTAEIVTNNAMNNTDIMVESTTHCSKKYIVLQQTEITLRNKNFLNSVHGSGAWK